MSAGPPSRSTAVPEEMRGSPWDEVNTNSVRCPSSRSQIAGLLESTAPGNVSAGAGVSVARGMGGAVSVAKATEPRAAVVAIRLEPGTTFGRTSRTRAIPSDDEILVFTASDYGRV